MCRARSSSDLLAARAARDALAPHLLDPGRGHPQQGGVHRGEEPGQRDQQDRDHEQGDRAGLIGDRAPCRPATGHGLARRRPPALEQLLLQPEHLPLLLGLRVVVAEQVQDAVGGEQLQLVVDGVAGGGAPARRRPPGTARRRRAAPAPGPGRRAGPVSQLVHREGEHVGRARLAHPPLVQLGHVSPSTQQHRQLGQRVDPHLVEHVPGDRGQRRLVDVDPGLVGDLDGHGQLPWRRGRRRPAPGAPAPGGRGAACRVGVPALVGVDDVADQPVPDDVGAGQLGEVRRPRCRRGCPGRPAARCCVPPGRSTWVTSPVTTILEPKPSRVRNIFICSARGVLRLVEDDERVVERVVGEQEVLGDVQRVLRRPPGCTRVSASPAGSMLSMKRIGRPPPVASYSRLLARRAGTARCPPGSRMSSDVGVVAVVDGTPPARPGVGPPAGRRARSRRRRPATGPGRSRRRAAGRASSCTGSGRCGPPG